MEFSECHILTYGQNFATWSIGLNISHMNTCMQFSSLKYEILHISPVKMIAQTFQNKIGILYISYEYLCAYFSLDIMNFMFYTCEKQSAVFVLYEM